MAQLSKLSKEGIGLCILLLVSSQRHLDALCRLDLVVSYTKIRSSIAPHPKPLLLPRTAGFEKAAFS